MEHDERRKNEAMSRRLPMSIHPASCLVGCCSLWFSVIQRILGILFMMHSDTLLPPLLVGFIYAESEWAEFLFTFGVLFLVGAAIWWPVRGERRELRTRDGFIIVVMFWTE